MVSLIIKPIRRLHRGVEAISTGNYEARVEKTTNDEVGDLTEAFNRMAKNLKEKELVKNMFSKYLSPDIADYILNNPEELKLGGENRELTIMFADIRGFTSLSENFPPQDIVNLLNSYFTSMVDIIFEYKGTLDKFLGDGLLAIFGAPVKYPNHAYNSVQAAVRMVKYIKRYNKNRVKWGYEPIHIGIGINTGKAIIGNIGSKQRAEYTVIGDTVNTCSRIEGLTDKNEIYISQSTYELVKDDIIYEYIGKHKVKNKKNPIKIYRVIDLK
jgi:class 3 adenylate cyclase